MGNLAFTTGGRTQGVLQGEKREMNGLRRAGDNVKLDVEGDH